VKNSFIRYRIAVFRKAIKITKKILRGLRELRCARISLAILITCKEVIM